MKHYYIIDSSAERGFREVAEEVFIAFVTFSAEVRTYTEQVTNGDITIEDVPETHRAYVETKLAPIEME